MQLPTNSYDEIVAYGWSSAALMVLWPRATINAVIKGRRGVSADTALLFEALTHWDAEIWLTLQAKWDLWHPLKARGRRPKVRALRKSA